MPLNVAVPRRGALLWCARVRDRFPPADHLVRAVRRYLDHRGYQQAATITYFSVLSLVPLLMVGLAVIGFVLAGHPVMLGRVRAEIATAVPPTLSPLLDGLAGNVVDHRLALGLFGLLVAGYSGWNWMNAVRDALTGMWQLGRSTEPVLLTVLTDLLALLGLGAALLVTFALSAAGGTLAPDLLTRAGLDGSAVAHLLLSGGAAVLVVLTDWLLFLYVLARLPRRPVPSRAARTPALCCALGFEVLKRVANVYLQALGRSPTGIAFGSVVGVLVFTYLVARMVVLAAAWIATATTESA